ncbi:hypothetical protein MBOT_38150 [Mycobacterium botniense]|uniref:Uncharacterized protein n=1 Tax=Mycobacterium botniense TaxID=84962 RepID=A0A7I9Y324_9MYCO|nr:hypothetical protein MBOT_38150 [Mycobacterium botniense]
MALMMPAPTNTTSVFAVVTRSGTEVLLVSGLCDVPDPSGYPGRCGRKRVPGHQTAAPRAPLVATDHRDVPSAVLTDPPITTVGLTENRAFAQGFDVCVVQHHSDVAYGWTMTDTTGIADPGDELRADRRRDSPRRG